MKKAFHRRWRVIWSGVSEYVFLGNKNSDLRTQVLFILEHMQGLFTRLPQIGQGKKRGRLLRRMLPSLFCLLFGFILFAPAHAQNTPPAHTYTTTVVRQQTRAQDSTDCDTSLQYDALSGLPVPEPNGNTPCTVPIRNACLTTSIAPNVTPAITSAATTPDWFFNNGTGLLFATNDITQNPWNVVLAIALALLAGPIILAGYQIMLGAASTHYAGAIATLSRVVLVALVALLSYTLISAVFNLEGDIASALNANTGFANNIDTVVVIPASDWCMHAQNFFGNLYNLNIDQLLNAQQSLTGTSYASAVYTTTLNLINELPAVVETLLSILLATQLLVRAALLWLYFTVSPLAIVSSSLPGESAKNVTWAWVRGFLALLLVQLLQLLVLGIGSKLIPAALTTVPTTPTAGVDYWFNQALNTLLPAIVIITTLNIPRLLNVSTTNLLATVSGSMGGAMTNVILIVRGF